MGFNIAIDGPAGAGKSTVAKAVAQKLGFIYVDTGAMYRALALFFIRRHIDAGESEKIKELLDQIQVSLDYDDSGVQQVFLNKENVTSQLRREDVGKMASAISAYPFVREKLLGLQRSLAQNSDVIMDGRDIGTNILPDAPLKIYLTASVEARAKRRYDELCEKGEKASLETVALDIRQRDESDMTRAIAPLRQAEDAVYLDTSDLDIPQVIQSIMNLYEKANKGDVCL